MFFYFIFCVIHQYINTKSIHGIIIMILKLQISNNTTHKHKYPPLNPIFPFPQYNHPSKPNIQPLSTTSLYHKSIAPIISQSNSHSNMLLDTQCLIEQMLPFDAEIINVYDQQQLCDEGIQNQVVVDWKRFMLKDQILRQGQQYVQRITRMISKQIDKIQNNKQKNVHKTMHIQCYTKIYKKLTNTNKQQQITNTNCKTHTKEKQKSKHKYSYKQFKQLIAQKLYQTSITNSSSFISNNKQTIKIDICEQLNKQLRQKMVTKINIYNNCCICSYTLVIKRQENVGQQIQYMLICIHLNIYQQLHKSIKLPQYIFIHNNNSNNSQNNNNRQITDRHKSITILQQSFKTVHQMLKYYIVLNLQLKYLSLYYPIIATNILKQIGNNYYFVYKNQSIVFYHKLIYQQNCGQTVVKILGKQQYDGKNVNVLYQICQLLYYMHRDLQITITNLQYSIIYIKAPIQNNKNQTQYQQLYIPIFTNLIKTTQIQQNQQQQISACTMAYDIVSLLSLFVDKQQNAQDIHKILQILDEVQQKKIILLFCSFVQQIKKSKDKTNNTTIN